MQMRDDRASAPDALQASTRRAGMDIEDSYEVDFEDDGDQENDDGDEDEDLDDDEQVEDEYDEFLFADEEDDL